VHPTVAAIVGLLLISIQTQLGVKNTDQMDRADIGEELIQVKKIARMGDFLGVGFS
jgi:hypothetical protein